MILLILAPCSMLAGELRIAPEEPKANDIINFTYSPDDRFADKSDLKAVLYAFKPEAAMPEAVEANLNYDPASQKAVGNLRMPANTVFALVKVDGPDENFDAYDDNMGEYNHILVYGADGKPLEGANLKAALSYLGSFPENFLRNVDYDKAMKHLRQETALYPDNIQAQIGLTSLQYDLRKLTFDNYEEEMKKQIDKKYDKKNENTIRAVSRALKSLNRESTANSLEKEFAEQNPKSDLAEEMILSQLSAAKSLDQFTKIAVDYLYKFPKSPNREKIFSAIVTSYLQINKYDELKALLDKIPDVPPLVYSQITLSLIQNEKILPNLTKAEKTEEAISLYNFHLKYVIDDEKIGEETKNKPVYFSDTEWKTDRNIMRASLAMNAAEIFIQAGEKLSAQNLYEKALTILGFRTDVYLYESLIEVCLRRNDEASAMKYLEQAILSSNDSKKILDLHKKLSKKMRPSEYESYDSSLEELFGRAKESRLAELKYRSIKKEPVCGVFLTIDGRVFDMEDLKGKISVVSFWSTWCEPCEVVSPALEEAFYLYQNNDEVFIIGIDVWEKEDDRARAIYQYLKKNDVRFPIFYDEYDIIPKKLGITGLPTIVYFDRDGNARFIQRGFTNETDFLRGMSDRIDYLLQE